MHWCPQDQILVAWVIQEWQSIQYQISVYWLKLKSVFGRFEKEDERSQP